MGTANKWPREGAICSIVCLVVVVPVVIPNHDAAVAIVLVMIPSAMPASIVFIKPNSRSMIPVAVVVTVAAHVDAKPGSIGEGRGTHREGSQRGDCVGELPHLFLLRLRLPERNRMPAALVAGTAQELF